MQQFKFKTPDFIIKRFYIIKSISNLDSMIIKKLVRFNAEQIVKIQDRFNEFAEKQKLSLNQFKNSMGLLGIGQGQPISQRIFKLITPNSEVLHLFYKLIQATFQQFLQFLDTITNGTSQQKAQTSFKFLDRNRKGFINYDDIQIIISQISFLWYFLTGQQISNSAAIDFICSKLGIDQTIQIGQGEYFLSYDQQFNWFDYFNHKLNPSSKQFLTLNGRMSKVSKQSTYQNPSSNQQFPIDQLEQYLKLAKSQLQSMLVRLKSIFYPNKYLDQTASQKDIDEDSKSILWQLSSIMGPQLNILTPQKKLKGDTGRKEKITQKKVIYQHQLQKQLTSQGNTELQVITNRMKQLAQMPQKLLKFPINPHNTVPPQLRQKSNSLRRLSKNRFSYVYSDQDKKASINKTQPVGGKRVNIVYFGHQNWNLMLNVMLGIRKSVKQHYFIYTNKQFEFSEEDLTCKYIHELLYKKNNKSVKQVSQTFVDYCPKVFFYIRKWFNIDNHDYLKSIGLQNLIGNLLLGNLSTLTDQTSQGKSGSFMYYTQDSKLILKSISRQQYKKFRQILKDYCNHLKQNPQTFLIKVYGLYKLKSKSNSRQIYFIVLNNIFDKGVQINERYDIKGSTYNRQLINEENPYISQEYSKNMALKDMDLINNSKRVFDIPNNQKQRIYNQILSDARFLCDHNIIEYSLLIGISKIKDKPSSRFSLDQISSQNNKHENFSHEIWNLDKTQNYFFGLIDIFSQYSVKKVFENHFFHTIGIFMYQNRYLR